MKNTNDSNEEMEEINPLQTGRRNQQQIVNIPVYRELDILKIIGILAFSIFALCMSILTLVYVRDMQTSCNRSMAKTEYYRKEQGVLKEVMIASGVDSRLIDEAIRRLEREEFKHKNLDKTKIDIRNYQ